MELFKTAFSMIAGTFSTDISTTSKIAIVEASHTPIFAIESINLIISYLLVSQYICCKYLFLTIVMINVVL